MVECPSHSFRIFWTHLWSSEADLHGKFTMSQSFGKKHEIKSQWLNLHSVSPAWHSLNSLTSLPGWWISIRKMERYIRFWTRLLHPRWYFVMQSDLFRASWPSHLQIWIFTSSKYGSDVFAHTQVFFVDVFCFQSSEKSSVNIHQPSPFAHLWSSSTKTVQVLEKFRAAFQGAKIGKSRDRKNTAKSDEMIGKQEKWQKNMWPDYEALGRKM